MNHETVKAMRPRKVVIVSRIFLPEPAAASFRLAALARGFAAEGADVTVLTTNPPRAMAAATVDERTASCGSPFCGTARITSAVWPST